MDYLKNSSSEAIFSFSILLPSISKVPENGQSTSKYIPKYYSTSTLLLLYFYSTPEQSILKLLGKLLEQFRNYSTSTRVVCSKTGSTLLLLEQFRNYSTSTRVVSKTTLPNTALWAKHLSKCCRFFIFWIQTTRVLI